MKKCLRYSVSFVLILSMSISLALNREALRQIGDALNHPSEEKTTTEVIASLSDVYKSHFIGQTLFTDLYGETQKILNKKIIGNYEFVKDNNGDMQMFENFDTTTDFPNKVVELKTLCDESNIPFIYFQCPARISSADQFPEGYLPNNEQALMNCHRRSILT